MFFVKAIDTGAYQRRNRQIKRKISSGFAGKAKDHAPNDGCPASAGTWNHGETLHKAYFQGI